MWGARGDDPACAWACVTPYKVLYNFETFAPQIFLRRITVLVAGITSLTFQDTQCGISASSTELVFFFLHQSFQENPFSGEEFTSILLSHHHTLCYSECQGSSTILCGKSMSGWHHWHSSMAVHLLEKLMIRAGLDHVIKELRGEGGLGSFRREIM